MNCDENNIRISDGDSYTSVFVQRFSDDGHDLSVHCYIWPDEISISTEGRDERFRHIEFFPPKKIIKSVICRLPKLVIEGGTDYRNHFNGILFSGKKQLTKDLGLHFSEGKGIDFGKYGGHKETLEMLMKGYKFHKELALYLKEKAPEYFNRLSHIYPIELLML